MLGCLGKGFLILGKEHSGSGWGPQTECGYVSDMVADI